MRTNIDIDDKLMKAAMKASGKKTKRETVEAGLRRLVERSKPPKMLDLFGKLDWDGYPIDALRRDRPSSARQELAPAAGSRTRSKAEITRPRARGAK